MIPVSILTADGHEISLTEDANGYLARTDDYTIYVSMVRTAVSPSHARWA